MPTMVLSQYALPMEALDQNDDVRILEDTVMIIDGDRTAATAMTVVGFNDNTTTNTTTSEQQQHHSAVTTTATIASVGVSVLVLLTIARSLWKLEQRRRHRLYNRRLSDILHWRNVMQGSNNYFAQHSLHARSSHRSSFSSNDESSANETNNEDNETTTDSTTSAAAWLRIPSMASFPKPPVSSVRLSSILINNPQCTLSNTSYGSTEMLEFNLSYTEEETVSTMDVDVERPTVAYV